MSAPPPGSQAVDRALRLLTMMVDSHGRTPLADAARELGLAVSTAHRLAATLEAHGLLVRTARGRYQGGVALARCAAAIDPANLLARAARPVLRTLARTTGRTAHLGIFEADMVTYLVRESPPGRALFTREAMQLEAYCSAVGKMLLTMVGEAEREAYLASGSFVPLTRRTITDRDVLRDHLRQVERVGHAVDDEEVEDGLFCIAIPLDTGAGLPPAALSLAGPVAANEGRGAILSALTETRDALGTALQPR